jgi:hypothetical protein
MPRKSAEAIAGEIWRNQHYRRPHPKPPASLDERGRKYWRDIVESKPPEYFDVANQLYLEQLCHSFAHSDLIWAEVNRLDPSDPTQFRRYRSLLVMAFRQTQVASLMLTKLRLLPTRYMAEKAASGRQSVCTEPLLMGKPRPPWEDD